MHKTLERQRIHYSIIRFLRTATLKYVPGQVNTKSFAILETGKSTYAGTQVSRVKGKQFKLLLAFKVDTSLQRKRILFRITHASHDLPNCSLHLRFCCILDHSVGILSQKILHARLQWH